MMAEPERSEFMERHYTLAELAKAWHMSERSLRPWFIDEQGVIKWGTGKLTRGRKKVYVSMRVPESVARRVYRRRTGKDIQPGRDK